MKVSSDTVARTIVLMIALINQVLVVLGKNVLPFAENDVYQLVSLIATFAAAGLAWWKNNSFTQEAIQADEYMKKLKEEEKEN